MTYEVYHYISIGAAIAAAVMLAVSVILFFVLKIPRVISDLSGRTARLAIEDIRKQNEASGDKSHRSSSVNLRRGKLTEKIPKSGRIQHPPTGRIAGHTTGRMNTQSPLGKSQKMGSQKMPGSTGKTQNSLAPQNATRSETVVLQDQDLTMVLGEENVTTVLPDPDATAVLPENNATVVLSDGDATKVLPQAEDTAVLPESNATVVLADSDVTAPLGAQPPESDVTAVLPVTDEAEAPTVGPEELTEVTAILPNGSETTVLNQGSETSVLYTPPKQEKLNLTVDFTVVAEITFIHTQEVIPTEVKHGW